MLKKKKKNICTCIHVILYKMKQNLAMYFLYNKASFIRWQFSDQNAENLHHSINDYECILMMHENVYIAYSIVCNIKYNYLSKSISLLSERWILLSKSFI